jgi:multidrug efflux system membrane fusion protein
MDEFSASRYQERSPQDKPIIGQDHQLNAPQGEHKTHWVLWAIMLLLFVVIVYAWMHRAGNKKAATPKAATVTVTQATATKGNIGVYLDAIGTVTPVYTSQITAQASGLITQVNYREGQLVQKGQSLVEIDPRPYEAQLLQAQGALERDTNLLAEAQMDLDRYRAAWAKNAIPKQTLDDQEKLVLQDQGTVKNDQGTVNYDQVELGYCHIVAPFTGVVGLRIVDPGNVVSASSTTVLAVITQEQPITVIFTLAEDSLTQVQARMRKMHTLPVEAWDRAQTTKLGDGKLLTIDNLIDTATGTVKLRAQFANRNGALFPNQFVNTRLLVNSEDNVILIPTSAIQHNGDKAFVYLITKGAANMHTITTGTEDHGTTAVTGLNAGDEVATSSFDKLQNGSKVMIAKGTGATATSAASSASDGSAEGNTP